MPGISRIPENINQYAIQWAKKICHEPIENGKGLDFHRGRIIQESRVCIGSSNSLNNYDFRYEPKDIFVHNHPYGSPLSLYDVSTAAFLKMKKIFASAKHGYTAMDFTTAYDHITSEDMDNWAIKANKECMDFIRDLDRTVDLEQDSGKRIMVAELNNIKIADYLRTKLQQFAEYSGATFENVKWTDFKQK